MRTGKVRFFARKCLARTYQFFFYRISNLINTKEPKLLRGVGSLCTLPQLLKEAHHQHVLVLTTPGMLSRGQLLPFFEALRAVELVL